MPWCISLDESTNQLSLARGDRVPHILCQGRSCKADLVSSATRHLSLVLTGYWRNAVLRSTVPERSIRPMRCHSPPCRPAPNSPPFQDRNDGSLSSHLMSGPRGRRHQCYVLGKRIGYILFSIGRYPKGFEYHPPVYNTIISQNELRIHWC